MAKVHLVNANLKFVLDRAFPVSTYQALEKEWQMGAMMASNDYPQRRSRPEFRFFALAVCLLPLGIFTFHSSWPPWSWKRIYFSEGDIGKTIFACSGLFFGFAPAYFFFPRIFHCCMNRVLGQIHFWLNVIAFLVLLALPIYFNLVFHSPPDESKLGTAVRAFGWAMNSFFLGIEVLAIIQILFLANVLWSAFKGERTSGPLTLEPFPASKKA